jgi:hypothetical protein
MQDTKCPRCGSECAALNWNEDFESYIYECMFCAKNLRWEGGMVDGKFVPNNPPNRKNFTWVWYQGKKRPVD